MPKKLKIKIAVWQQWLRRPVNRCQPSPDTRKVSRVQEINISAKTSCKYQQFVCIQSATLRLPEKRRQVPKIHFKKIRNLTERRKSAAPPLENPLQHCKKIRGLKPKKENRQILSCCARAGCTRGWGAQYERLKTILQAFKVSKQVQNDKKTNFFGGIFGNFCQCVKNLILLCLDGQ